MVTTTQPQRPTQQQGRLLQVDSINVLVLQQMDVYGFPEFDIGWTITDKSNGELVASSSDDEVGQDAGGGTNAVGLPLDPEDEDSFVSRQRTVVSLERNKEYDFALTDEFGWLQELHENSGLTEGFCFKIYLGTEMDDTKLLVYKSLGSPGFATSGSFVASESATLPPVTSVPSATPSANPSMAPTVTASPSGEQIMVCAVMDFFFSVLPITPGWIVTNVATGEVVFQVELTLEPRDPDVDVVPALTYPFSVTKGQEYLVQLDGDADFLVEVGIGLPPDEFRFQFIVYLGTEKDDSQILLFQDGLEGFTDGGTFVASPDALLQPITNAPTANPSAMPSAMPTTTASPTVEQVSILVVMAPSSEEEFGLSHFPGWVLTRADDGTIVFEEPIAFGRYRYRKELSVDKDTEYVGMIDFPYDGADGFLDLFGGIDLVVYLGATSDNNRVLYFQEGLANPQGFFSFVTSESALLPPLTRMPTASLVPTGAPTSTPLPTGEQISVTVALDLGVSPFAVSWSILRASDETSIFFIPYGTYGYEDMNATVTSTVRVDRDEEYIFHLIDRLAARPDEAERGVIRAAVYFGGQVDRNKALVYLQDGISPVGSHRFVAVETAVLPRVTNKPSPVPTKFPSQAPTVTAAPSSTPTNVTVVLEYGDVTFSTYWTITAADEDYVDLDADHLIWESPLWGNE